MASKSLNSQSLPVMAAVAQSLFEATNESLTLEVNGTEEGDEWFKDADYDFSDSSNILDCPVYSMEDGELLDSVTFWVDGVITCIMAIIGLVANIISALILGK